MWEEPQGGGGGGGERGAHASHTFSRAVFVCCGSSLQPLPLEQLYNRNGCQSYRQETNTSRQ